MSVSVCPPIYICSGQRQVDRPGGWGESVWIWWIGGHKEGVQSKCIFVIIFSFCVCPINTIIIEGCQDF